jgi:hypothetical protein
MPRRFCAFRFMMECRTLLYPGTTIRTGSFLPDQPKVCVEDRRRNDSRQAGSSSVAANGDDSLLWKHIWKLNCPRKMQHFLWLLGHKSLALRVNLKRRRMKLDTVCCLCRRLDEDEAHLFLEKVHITPSKSILCQNNPKVTLVQFTPSNYLSSSNQQHKEIFLFLFLYVQIIF